MENKELERPQAESRELSAERRKLDRQQLLLKVVVALIALSIVGTVVCIILDVLRVAVEAVVIAGGILLVIVLLGFVSYKALIYRWQARSKSGRPTP